MRQLQHGSTGFNNFATWHHNSLISQFSVLCGRILGELQLPAFGAAQLFARGNRLLFALAVVVVLGLSDLLHAQKPPQILFPYSVVNYSSLPWMIAKDAGLFRKQDLDVDLVFMGSSNLIIQSMLAGSVPVAGVAGPAVISSVVAGGDVVTVANLAPLTIALMVNPSIQKPEDLKGKRIGVPRLGAVAHFAIRMILDRHGIKDTAIIQMGSQPEAAAGMRRQSIDGAMISLPLNYVLEKEGYRQLVGPQDYRKLGIQFISQGISARKSYIASNRDVVLRLIKATMEGLKLMSTQESTAKKILAKYTRQTDSEALDRAYRFGLQTLNRDPTIPQEAIVSMIRLMADLALIDRSTASNTPSAAFYDNSFADEMKRTGFLAELWK
ncbi:MAG TPA: ABC transporter substrate-binding protein [Candidatus Binatia bacterium]